MSNVDQALGTINDRLEYGLFDWAITRNDVLESNAALATLSPSERNELISRLDDGKLQRWAENATADLDAGERQDLFNSLAGSLDATQLGRAYAAFGGQEQSQREFNTAISSQAPQAVREAFQAQYGSTAIDDFVATFPPGPLSAQEYQDLAVQYVRDKAGDGVDNIYDRNYAITQAYAEMYFANPDAYKWAGMAAFASNLVGDGIRQAEAGRQAGLPLVPGVFDFSFTGLSHSLQQGNALVYTDIFWQHLAYEHGGMPAIERAHAEGAIPDRVLEAWQQIDSGIRTGNDDMIWAGNEGLLRYEQQVTLQTGVYDQNRRTYEQLSSGLVGIVQPLTSPIPGDDVSFQDYVPGGDIGDFGDRWTWISESMLPAWRAGEPTLGDDLFQFTQPR